MPSAFSLPWPLNVLSCASLVSNDLTQVPVSFYHSVPFPHQPSLSLFSFLSSTSNLYLCRIGLFLACVRVVRKNPSVVCRLTCVLRDVYQEKIEVAIGVPHVQLVIHGYLRDVEISVWHGQCGQRGRRGHWTAYVACTGAEICRN